MASELGLLVKQIRGGEAGLATGEASLILALLGRVPCEEGSGHAWLLACRDDGTKIGFGPGRASALATISPKPFGMEPNGLLALLRSPRVLAVGVWCVWGRALRSLAFVSWREGQRLVVLVGSDLLNLDLQLGALVSKLLSSDLLALEARLCQLFIAELLGGDLLALAASLW